VLVELGPPKVVVLTNARKIYEMKARKSKMEQKLGKLMILFVVLALCATTTLAGWTKVDDADASISYTGDWEFNSGVGWAYMGTIHSGAISGVYVSYTFDGTQVRLYAGTQQWGGNGDIYIDDDYQTTVSFYSPTSIGDVMLYESGTLSSGSHTIRVEEGGEIYIDAFEHFSDVDDTDPPSPDPMTWTFVPNADSDTQISMTATTATDPSGVEYYFAETSGNPGASDSGWQDSRGHTDTGLDAATQYCYEIQARDKSANQNATAWSTNECATTQSGGSGTPISITNPSFESGSTGWSGATTNNSEYYASPDGENYATRSGGSGYTSQLTGHTIAAGETYELKVWARSINAKANSAATNAEVRFYYGSTTITAFTRDVYPVALSGSPATIHNDDGGNVWIDGNYRMACAGEVFYQTVDKDPISDPWSHAGEQGYDCGGAPIMTPEGFDAIMGCACASQDPVYSCQEFGAFTGSPPFYNHSPAGDKVLSHDGDENPYVIDAHLYYDYATSRLWMTWGGGVAYVSELDPSDGFLIDHPSNHEFDTHPSWYHTLAALWSGDEWTGSNTWVEGPSLYKHNGYWYLFTTAGDMNSNYTIRMGRGSSPNGPFYDKDGVGMTEYDSGENEYGNSFLLGDEGEYVVPGHPHLWEESGITYMGYDYRPNSGSNPDLMGIRYLYWVNGWPTIWTPITVTFNANDYPGSIGQELGISLRNTGSGSNAAFDHVSLDYTGGTPDTDPPSPDPMTWASVPTADDQDSISMTATTATDVSGVEYYFDETSGNPGGSDSNWQANTNYTDSDLSAGTQYSYQVRARDKSSNQNETDWSTPLAYATTESGPVFADNFESSTDWSNNWTAYGAWQRKTARSYDGSYSAEIDGNVTDSALVSAAIDVTGKTDATVTFAWFIEKGLDSGEYLRFDVDTGSGWVQKASLDGNVDTENTWHNESIPVDVSATSTMYIRFRGKMNKSNEDAYVDVVVISAQ